MSKRQLIIDYLENLIKSNISDFKTVEQNFRPVENYQDFELPSCSIIIGRETREAMGRRLLCDFEVILRLVIYDIQHLTTTVNDLIDKVLSLLEQNMMLGGYSEKPISISEIETTQGWFTPLEVVDITVHAYYITNCVV